MISAGSGIKSHNIYRNLVFSSKAAPFCQDVSHIFRQRGRKIHGLSGDRMRKGKPERMECLTADIFHIWIIEVVSHQREAQVL